MTRKRVFFMKTAVTRERKVEKSLPRWEMNGFSEGYKWAVDQNRGRMAKIGFFSPKTRFRAEEKKFLISTMFWPRPEKVVQSCLFPNQYQSLKKFWVFFWVKMHFWPNNYFSADPKNGCFSVIRPVPSPLSFWVTFLMALMFLPNFFENSKKLRMLILVIGEWPETAKNRAEP